MQKRLEPKPLEMAILDDIRTILYDLREIEREGRAEGIVEPIEPVTIHGDERRLIRPRSTSKPWHSVTVVNDGPNDVQALVNTQKSLEWHRVANGETYTVDMHRSVIGDVLLTCATGETASIRVVGAR